MIIDGDRVPMEPGDLILTPGWSWHGHVHPGGDEPAVWMDGLDVPFVLGLRAGFIRDDPHSGDPLPVRDTTGTGAGTAALLPAGTRNGQHSPVRRYPWDETYPALRRLMARSPGRGTLTSLQYRNPLTGGPALATLGCLLQGLPAGARTRARRVQDLDTAAVLPDPRAERRRRLAEPDLEFRAFCARKGLPASSTPQLERAWDAWQVERYRRGETGQRSGYTDNPFRPR